ncbi:hypothetical protein G3480_05960 [Thiorhodococcus mannitoliphagus]|uniref:Uncharacterized protein n=1 Tax=Thiorhodococcus mannitoliphagus TaxID=329406 RepID=A0A6P1DUZ2_9GAMM|nr:hypothetical protein [Thiorhodococcus mannitoliphagus]NEX19862.1 hypothetical protein [Thiorhodococcus mannitoliphagus]
MTDTTDPVQLLAHLARDQSDRPQSARVYIQQHQVAILQALTAGYSGTDLYQALSTLGDPPPMSLRHFRRYLVSLRQVVNKPVATPSKPPTPQLTPKPAPLEPIQRSRPPPLGEPPKTFRWDPLTDDSDID